MTTACSSVSPSVRLPVSEPETSGPTLEGGRCKDASSDASAYSPECPAQDRLRDARRTEGERPLQDDVIGNAIVSAAAAGLAGGLRAAATSSARTGVQEGVLGMVKSFVTGQGRNAVVATMKPGPEVPAPTPSTPSAIGDGGRTGKAGTSEVAPSPDRSEAPPMTPGPVIVRG